MGKAIYEEHCVACHQENGEGIPHAFPPLAKSDYFNADHKRAILTVLNGLEGAITVNGAPFDSYMPSIELTNEQIANVLTFVANSWGNDGGQITEDDIAKKRQ